MGTRASGWALGGQGREGGLGRGVYTASAQAPYVNRWARARRWGLAAPPALTSSTPVPSCVCKEGEVGDGRACYGHLLHEIQKAGQLGLVLLRLKVSLAMLGV